jgi:hypothetical protein
MGGEILRFMRSVQSNSSKKGCLFKAATPPIQNIVPRAAPNLLLLRRRGKEGKGEGRERLRDFVRESGVKR